MTQSWHMVTLLVTFACTAATAAEQAGWTPSVQPDPIRGGSLGIAQVVTSEATLAVRCDSSTQFSEVRLFHDRASAVDEARWRFDDGRTRTESWLSSPNGRSLVVPSVLHDEFLLRLKLQRQLHLELVFEEGSAREITLPLDGSAVSLHHALRACGE